MKKIDTFQQKLDKMLSDSIKPKLNEGLTKKSLENVNQDTIDDIHEGYYALTDVIRGKLRYALMQASQDNPDWKKEYSIFLKIQKLVNSLETSKIL